MKLIFLLAVLLASSAAAMVIHSSTTQQYRQSLEQEVISSTSILTTTTTFTDTVWDCGTVDDVLILPYVKLDPDPPRKGEKLNIEAHGWLKEEVINGSYIDVVVKFGVIKLLQQRMDLCEQTA